MKAFVVSQPFGRTSSKLVEANELLFIAAETYQKHSTSCDLSSISDVHDSSANHNLYEGEDDDQRPEAKVVRHESHDVTPALKTTGRGGEKKPEQSTVSAPAPVLPAPSTDYDVQRRFGSLLERMKKRQQQLDE